MISECLVAVLKAWQSPEPEGLLSNLNSAPDCQAELIT